MTLYLQLNGTSDYLQTPSVAVNKIVIEMQHDSDQPGTSYLYYMDFRPANSTWLYGHKTGDDQGWVGSVTNLIVDGTTYTNAWNGVGAIPKGVKTNLTLNLSAVLTGAINFFRKNDNTFKLKGRIHRITGYNGATVVFDYNMSTGTVNDQSGNGRHATLSGGTWVDDGVSAGTQHTGSASLLGTGTISASGTNIPASSASVSLIGSGLISATSKVDKQSGANLLGSGDLTATGINIVQAPAAPISGSSLYITDINGNTEALSGYRGLKRFSSVSGEKTLAFLILPTDKNIHSFNMVQEESIVEFKGESYRIKQLSEKNRGQTFYKEVVAIHTFFDLIDDFKYETYTGSMTFQAALQFVFTGTSYTWDIVDTFYAQDFDNFGNDNRLALFQEILKRYGAEFSLNGTHLTFKVKIGNNTDFQFRYNYNVKTITRNVNTNNLSTYGKGFGKKNEDGTYVIQTEYTSPNASIFGLRHAKPIDDERYTTAEGLLAAIKANMKDTPDVSITIDFVDMRRAGFPYDVPNEGDYLFLIFEPMNNLDLEARLMDIEEEFDEFNDYPLRTAVTIANFRNNMTDKFMEFSRTQKQVDSVISTDGKVRYNALDEAVRRATEALQAAQTELEFENGIIARDKNNPNFLVLFNSNGIGISRDGGQTFKEALTSDGFVASAGVVGQFAANNIQIGPDTTFQNGYNPAEIVVASKNIMQNSGYFVNTDYWGLNGGTLLEVVDDNGRKILHCKGSVMGSNIPLIKTSTEYVFSAEVYFNKTINVSKFGPLHFWLGTSGDTSAALDSYELISTKTSLEPFKWHIIAIKIKTKASLPAGSFFKPFIYDPAQVGTTEEYWIRSMMFAEGNKLATWSPAPEDTNSAIVSAATKIKDDLRMSAPLPTSLTLNQDGIRASTSDQNRYAQMDYRGFFVKGGAVQIERPDGYLSVQDGILRNSLAIQGSEPAFQTAGVEKWGQFYRTKSNDRFENIQRFVFKHDSRYVRIICNLYADGGVQYGNWANAAFDIVTDDETTSIATAVVVENRWSDNQGYRKDILIDCGVPTGNLLVMYWRMWSLVNPYYTYGSVRYLVQEG